MRNAKMETGCAYIDDYANAILTGSIPAAKITKSCIRYHMRRLNEDGVVIETGQIERAKELIEKYFDFELMPWELYLLALIHVFKGGNVLFRAFFLMMGTGNGKNGFISALAWYFTTPDHGIREYNIDIIANSEEQAKISFNEVYNVLERWKKQIGKQYVWSRAHIENRATQSYIHYNTSSAKSAAGKRAAVLVFDEIFMYADSSLIGEHLASFGKRPNSRIFYITSNGNVREGVLDTQFKIAKDVIVGENDDARYCPMIYAVESEAEARNAETWVKANPSLPYMPRLMDEIKTDYALIDYDDDKVETFFAKRMNWPKAKKEKIVATHDEMLAASSLIDIDLEGRDCVAGLDFALLSDMASVGLLFRNGDRRYWIQHTWFCRDSVDWGHVKAPLEDWQERGDLTICDGPQIDPYEISNWLAEAQQRYAIKKIAIDMARFSLVREILGGIGFIYDRSSGNIELVRPLQIASVSPVIDSWFKTNSICWGDVPLMRWATNNTKKVRMKAESASGNFKYDKIEPRSRKTDPFMALVHAATLDGELAVQNTGWILDLPAITG